MKREIEWQDMSAAPKHETIEGLYEDGVVCEITWSERPICMLGSANGGFPAGWATPCGGITDSNLPMDTPIKWRPIHQEDK